MSAKNPSSAEAIARLKQRPTSRTAPLIREQMATTGASGGTSRHAAPNAGNVVSGHKFRTGQTVTLLPTHYGAHRNGTYEVKRLLPREHGVNQYRLKSGLNGHERVANEDELK